MCCFFSSWISIMTNYSMKWIFLQFTFKEINSYRESLSLQIEKICRWWYSSFQWRCNERTIQWIKRRRWYFFINQTNRKSRKRKANSIRSAVGISSFKINNTMQRNDKSSCLCLFDSLLECVCWRCFSVIWSMHGHQVEICYWMTRLLLN